MAKGIERITFADDRLMWDQQPGQSEKHHGYLMEYLKQGRGRSLSKLAPTLGVRASWLEQISSHHQWSRVAAEWDAEQDRAWHVEMDTYRKRAAIERYDVATDMLRVCRLALAAFVASDAVDVPPAAVASMARAADAMFRGVLGEADHRTEVTGAAGNPIEVELLDLADLSPAARTERVAAILDRIDYRRTLIANHYGTDHTDTDEAST